MNDSDIALWSYLNFFLSVLNKQKKKNTNPVMKINFEIFLLAKDQIGARCSVAIFSNVQLNQPRLKINAKTELQQEK